MASAIKAQTATLQQYTEIITPEGDIHISAKDGAVILDQYLTCQPPCLIMYNPANYNFFAYHDIRDMELGMKFVSLITTIA